MNIVNSHDEDARYSLAGSMALRTVLDSLAVALAGQVALALLAGGPGGTRAPARVRDRGRGLDPAADALGA